MQVDFPSFGHKFMFQGEMSRAYESRASEKREKRKKKIVIFKRLHTIYYFGYV